MGDREVRAASAEPAALAAVRGNGSVLPNPLLGASRGSQEPSQDTEQGTLIVVRAL